MTAAAALQIVRPLEAERGVRRSTIELLG